MSVFSLETVLNSSYFDVAFEFWGCLLTFLTDKATDIQQNQKVFSAVSGTLHFDEFQWKLFTGFAITLLLNLCLIFVSWRYYGKRICDRFMKPATSKAIEELKASVSRLKLPKEHSPRV